MTLLDKIVDLATRLKAKRGDPVDVNLTEAWYEEAKRLMLLKSLAEHDGVKYVIGIFGTEVDQINRRLSQEDSKTMPDSLRDRLIDKRNLAQKYLDLFASVEDDLEKLEEAVDAEKI